MDDGCCESDGRKEDLWTSVIAGRHTPPILEPAEHDLDPVAAFVAALIIFDWRLAFLSAPDTGAYPLVSQRFSKPISVIPAIPEQPFDLWETTEQSPCANVIADLSCSDKRSVVPGSRRWHAASYSCRLWCDRLGDHAPPFWRPCWSLFDGPSDMLRPLPGSRNAVSMRGDHDRLFLAVLGRQTRHHPSENAFSHSSASSGCRASCEDHRRQEHRATLTHCG